MNETMTGACYDSLMGGAEGRYDLNWLKTSSDTTIERGALLAGGYDGSDVTVHLATASDTVDTGLFVAAHTKPAGLEFLTGYSSGVFNRAAIKLGEGLKVEDFELELRRQQIRLTEVL